MLLSYPGYPLFSNAVMPGLVPGIHVLGSITQERSGWLGQARP
jgi:hypothetical protein